jgi:hypothetical protein
MEEGEGPMTDRWQDIVVSVLWFAFIIHHETNHFTPTYTGIALIFCLLILSLVKIGTEVTWVMDRPLAFEDSSTR